MKVWICDIWRIRTLKKTLHISSKPDLFFVSNTLQHFAKKAEAFTSFSTDHSPIFFSFEKGNGSVRGRGLRKFNKSLISDSEYIESMKKTFGKRYA